MLLSIGLQFNAQTTIFEETFETTASPNLPTGWAMVDRDGEGSKWAVIDNAPNMGGGMTGRFVATVSINSSGDHLLSSPVINLQGNSSYSLTYQIGVIGATQDAPYPSENHYALYILPATGVFTGNETPIFEETVSSLLSNPNLRTVNLSNYAGQNIKMHFRQFNGPASYGSMLMMDDVRITQQQVLATSEVNSNAKVGIYPNPTSDYVFLKSKSKITKAEVFDIAGRKMNVGFNENRVDVRNLKSGAYMLKVTSENKTYSQKIIKK